MHLSEEEKEIGRQNFYEAVGTTRREFLRNTILAGGTAFSASLGANYFNYGRVDDRLRVGIIGTGDEGGVLIGALNPEYIDVRAVADIRPYSVHRAFHGDWYSAGAHTARPGLMDMYGWTSEDEARQNVKVFEDENGGYQNLIDEAADLNIEAVIIALPLHLHDAAAIYAMRSGLHVLTEKLMAHSVRQCKEMARVAASSTDPNGNPIVLATGHQRHYSVLYDNAVDQIRQGLIGDIHHIRAQWHRGNMPGSDSWQPPLPELGDFTKRDFDIARREAESRAEEMKIVEAHPLYAKLHSWTGRHKNAKGADEILWGKRLAQLHKQINDHVDAAFHGYQAKTLPGGYERSAIEELIRWRLWERTGGGLMAELGSHQLDAASIFISAQREDGKKVKPLNVTGVGGRSIFPLDREVDDHVYCLFEFPGKGYEDDPNKKIFVSYSSINGNGYGGWGEVVLGTKGTLILEREQEAMLFKGSNTTTRIEVKEGSGGAAMDTYETGGGAAVAQAATPLEVSRGYREEIEHWAYCIREGNPDGIRCKPEIALADAVIALVSNQAIAGSRQIEFRDEWFDIDSDETPEGEAPRKVDAIA